MQLTVDRKKLSQELGIASRITGSPAVMPILGAILLDVDKSMLRIAATNLETGFISVIAAETEKEGKAAVPGNLLTDLVSVLNEERTQLKLDAKTHSLQVKDGRSRSSIKCLSADDFPILPEMSIQGQITLDANDLKMAFQRAGVSVSRDEARPVLTGACMHILSGQIVITSADGFRLSVCKITRAPDSQVGRSIIIPGQALDEFIKALDDSKSVEIVIASHHNQVAFKFGTRLIVSQLIDGNFPDLDPVIPKNFNTSATLSRAALQNACKQARIFSQESKKDGGIVCMEFSSDSVKGGMVQVSGQSEETGLTTNSVEASVDGPAIKIAFNSTFFIDGLSAIRTPNVRIRLNADNRPAVIEPVGEEGYFYVLMPLQIGQTEGQTGTQPEEQPAAPVSSSPFQEDL